MKTGHESIIQKHIKNTPYCHMRALLILLFMVYSMNNCKHYFNWLRLKLKGNNCVYNYPVSDWKWAKNSRTLITMWKMKLVNLKNHSENMNQKFI